MYSLNIDVKLLCFDPKQSIVVCKGHKAYSKSTVGKKVNDSRSVIIDIHRVIDYFSSLRACIKSKSRTDNEKDDRGAFATHVPED